nr:unnamed protein product [Fasciola hepatica]
MSALLCCSRTSTVGYSSRPFIRLFVLKGLDIIVRKSGKTVRLGHMFHVLAHIGAGTLIKHISRIRFTLLHSDCSWGLSSSNPQHNPSSLLQHGQDVAQIVSF